MIQPEPEGSTQGYPLVSVEVLRFNTTAGNPVKKILLKLNLSDHRLFKDGGGGRMLSKEFQEDATLKHSKSQIKKEDRLSSRGSTSVAACIRLCLVCSSCLLEAAYVCDICTLYVSRQCTSSNRDSAAPCLLRRLATPD
ncbi:hypothetical protein Tco_0932769 [Tanacetum coccineum]